MSETTPKEQRGPTNLRIKFRSASLEQFIERYAADVSRGGIFIRTREPLSVGTQLRLELQLQDGMALLAGEGTVIWIRESDPARPTMPPGMAVRFDKVTDETQPTLDRILAERARMEEAGHMPAQPAGGGGMAVRRPSGMLSSLDTQGRVAEPASSAPTAPVSTQGGAKDAGGAGATPATKTSFFGSRAAAGSPAPAPAGPFTRARQTGTRPVPVPSALFEPPTAADIDKALSVLEEAPGAAPPRPVPSVPRFVPEDISNDPTRVGDLTAAASAEQAEAERAGATDVTAPGDAGDEPKLPVAAADGAAPAAEKPADKGAVAAPAAPDLSRRFRAASRAYPTLQRRRGTGVVVALIVVLGAAGAVFWKLRPGSRVPTSAPSIPAATVAPAQAPSAPPPPAPEAVPPAPTPPSEAAPPPAAEAAPPPAAAKPTAEKGPSSERGSAHRVARRKAHEEPTAAHAGGNDTTAAEKPAETKPAAEAPAADKPVPDKEAPAPADKPVEAKPASAVLKITSTPAGAEVSIDGSSVGNTPFLSKDIDPGAPHAITLKKDGFETHERMIGASDWSRPHGSAPPTLKVNVKLRRIAPAPEAPKDTNAPAEDTGGPYIKEVNPSNP